MLRFATVFAAMAMSYSALSAQTPAPSIKGVWSQVERETRGGPNAGIISGSEIQPYLLFYTDRHYASVRVLSTEPRSILNENPTDADLLAAWGPFAAHAGTYERNGMTITYRRIVGKDPNAMLPENATYSREIARLTEDTLETSATDANGVTTIFRYRRVE